MVVKTANSFNNDSEFESRNESSIVRTLNELYQNHSLFSRPDGFIGWLGAEERTKEDLKRFALLYYPHVTRTRLFQGALLSLCPTQDTQAAVAAILYDEYGRQHPSERHLVVYERLFADLGLQRPELTDALDAEVLGSRLYAAAMYGIVRQAHWARAYGAVGIGGELPIPALYRPIDSAYTRVFSSDLDPKALAIFRSHIDLDESHARSLIEAVQPEYISDPIIAKELEIGFLMNLEARQFMLDSIIARIKTG
uniref:Pyrroloquinoline quinone (PQQ) biosynthesis protein C n=1 Tax=Candidatus Kentrum sp. TC TaxID=2126339 RepID=A0A450Z5A1_9GAMM|nr:MAG: Pyrroloquinoline quinone (PQQ) biosynthesis protein C [Candidatus Kentron sp. TC]